MCIRDRHVTGEALKTAVFAAALFDLLGFKVTPRPDETRHDIIAVSYTHLPRDPDKIKFIIASETPLDEKSTCDSYLFSLARSTDGKAEYAVNVKNGELSVKNSDD